MIASPGYRRIRGFCICGTAFAPLRGKRNAMKEMNRKKHAEYGVAQPSDNPLNTRERAVTQESPDTVLADGGPMANSAKGASPTPRELEQDVMTTNPSIDSMESRG